MQKNFFLLLVIGIAFSCNTSSDKSTFKPDNADTSKPVYAYTIKYPDNWETGSSKNTAIVLVP